MLRLCLSSLRACLGHAARFALWTGWLLLALALAIQGLISRSNELRVPDFILHIMERDLTNSGVVVHLDKAVFDPSGRITAENVQINLSSFGEPVGTARAVFIKVDPWSLLAGHIEPSQVLATGLDLNVPAMLSESGRSERLVRDLDVQVTRVHDGIRIDYLTGHLGPLAVRAEGLIHIRHPSAGGPAGSATPAPNARMLAARYGAISRLLSRAVQQISGLEDPQLAVVFTPSDTRGAIVGLTLTARGWSGPGAGPVQATGLRASTRLPLLPDGPIMATVDASADEVRIRDDVVVEGARLRLRAESNLATGHVNPASLDLWANSAAHDDLILEVPWVHITPDGTQAGHPAYSGTVLGRLMGGPIEASGRWSPGGPGGIVHLNAKLVPELLGPLSARLGMDMRRFLDIPDSINSRLAISLDGQGRPLSATGFVSASNISIMGVKFDLVAGHVDYDGIRVVATDAVGIIGDDIAHGSFEQNFKTWDFRFLLDGRLRPLDIGYWFTDWWGNFFSNFSFPAALPPPAASVDVQGRWTSARPTTVFVRVEADNPTIRGTTFQRARTLIFLRPQFYDVFECTGSLDDRDVSGNFTVLTDFDRGVWTGLDFQLDCAADPAALAGMLGPDEAARLKDITYDQPPVVHAAGHLDGDLGALPRHRTVKADVTFGGKAIVKGLPVSDLKVSLALRDDALDLSSVQALLSGGRLDGTLRLTGLAGTRHLAASGSLHGASMGEVARNFAPLIGSHTAGGAPSLQTFAREKAAVKMDLDLAAKGTYGVLSSYTGMGKVQLQGQDLGSLSLLGGLSNLLKVTSLRFTNAQSNFTIGQAKIDFTDATATGANSAIAGKGTYAMDKHSLDFTAKVYPFKDSKAALQWLNLLTRPLSEALEVRLTGSVDKPSWSFSYSPRSLLLGEPRAAAAANGVGASPASPAPAQAPPPAPTSAPAPAAPGALP